MGCAGSCKRSVSLRLIPCTRVAFIDMPRLSSHCLQCALLRTVSDNIQLQYSRVLLTELSHLHARQGSELHIYDASAGTSLLGCPRPPDTYQAAKSLGKILLLERARLTRCCSFLKSFYLLHLDRRRSWVATRLPLLNWPLKMPRWSRRRKNENLRRNDRLLRVDGLHDEKDSAPLCWYSQGFQSE